MHTPTTGPGAEQRERALIAQRLTTARRTSGRSRVDAALSVDVSARTLSDWESARTMPGADRLRRLAQLYHVSAHYLLGLSDHPTGLPIGQMIVNLDGLERAEKAQSIDELDDLWADEGLVLDSVIPQRPHLVAVGDKVAAFYRDRIASVRRHFAAKRDGEAVAQ